MVNTFLVRQPAEETCAETFNVFSDHMIKVDFIYKMGKSKAPS